MGLDLLQTHQVTELSHGSVLDYHSSLGFPSRDRFLARCPYLVHATDAYRLFWVAAWVVQATLVSNRRWCSRELPLAFASDSLSGYLAVRDLADGFVRLKSNQPKRNGDGFNQNNRPNHVADDKPIANTRITKFRLVNKAIRFVNPTIKSLAFRTPDCGNRKKARTNS